MSIDRPFRSISRLLSLLDVCSSSSCGPLDVALDVKAGADTGILGGLALDIIEAGNSSDDGGCDGIAKAE